MVVSTRENFLVGTFNTKSNVDTNNISWNAYFNLKTPES